MKLNFVITQHIDGESISNQITVKASPDSYLINILEETGYILCDIGFPRYYMNCDEKIIFSRRVPFIIMGNKFSWDVPIDEIRTKDFILTHCIKKDEMIYVETNDSPGGFGDDEIIDLWKNVYPYLEHMVMLLTIFKSVKEFVSFIKKVFGSKYQREEFEFTEVPHPTTVFSAVFTRKQWMSSELAEKLNMEPEQAKWWLKALGYKWSKNAHRYVITDKQINEFWENIKTFIEISSEDTDEIWKEEIDEEKQKNRIS